MDTDTDPPILSKTPPPPAPSVPPQPSASSGVERADGDADVGVVRTKRIEKPKIERKKIMGILPATEKSMSVLKSKNYKFVNPVAYEQKVKLSKRKSAYPHLPKYILGIIAKNNFDLLDDDEAAKIFLQEMQTKRRVRGGTITRFFNILKPHLFPTTEIRPNTIAFDTMKAPQTRVPNFKAIKRLVDFLNDPNNKETTGRARWPILLAYYSGLRAAEICRFKTSNLVQLSNKESVVNLPRKMGATWVPIYYQKFNQFIEQMMEHYSAEVKAYKDRGIDVQLFKYSQRNLHYAICHLYILVNNEQPVTGFGLHMFRYYVASNIVKSGDQELARQFLGHKSLTTTQRYVRVDKARLEDKLNEINTTNKLYRKIIENNADAVGNIDNVNDLY